MKFGHLLDRAINTLGNLWHSFAFSQYGRDRNLWRAVMRNDAAEIEKQIAKGASVHCLDVYGRHNLLSMAGKVSSPEVIALLIDKGADPVGMFGGMYNPSNALIESVKAGRTDAVAIMLDKGAKIPPRALYIALEEKNIQMMDLLLSRGADPEAKDRYGYTILCHAAEKGYKEAVRLLLDKGARADHLTNDLNSVVDLARKSRNPDVLQMMQLAADRAVLEWRVADSKTVVHTQILRADQRKLTTVFNFGAGSIVSSVENLDNGYLSHTNAVIDAPEHAVMTAQARTFLAASANKNFSTNDNGRIDVFFDLDGVLADFAGHARAHGKFDAQGQTLWDKIDYQWWTTMPACKGAKEFYDDVKAMELGKVKFLTAASKSRSSFAGKADWVQTFAPERGKNAMLDIIIASAYDKELLAGPRRILIDDRQKNIDAWVAAGGIGILHTGDFAVTREKLQAVIAELKGLPVPAVAAPMMAG